MAFKTDFSIPSGTPKVDTDLKLQAVYITLHGQFQRTVYHDKGSEKEKVFLQDGDSAQIQLNFEGDKLNDVVKLDIEKAIKEVIEKIQKKYE